MSASQIRVALLTTAGIVESREEWKRRMMLLSVSKGRAGWEEGVDAYD